MYNKGDLIIYSTHGICRIDNITEKNIAGTTRTYYILSPIENNQHLTISIPVDNNGMLMLSLVNENEAKDILQTFESDGLEWIDNANNRNQVFNKKINSGDRKDIASIANTLIRKQHELKQNEKTLYENDQKLLTKIKSILFKEISLALNISIDEVNEKIQNKMFQTS
ncbi:CarD family transcriptional regulator [Aquisalibacillus elongatus]|uniref:CarD family transcriptional regulator n=1 Tax=Aquisalibacillus elongatus TaxID=485577 RepID=A0A3N5BRF5_9BACI|nr:CarD family transcriptional regulator [Aquisalibacillus elongatus]RPF50092.1 CarD family transcriptional regulator [Aquisalibacillus elongatus]